MRFLLCTLTLLALLAIAAPASAQETPGRSALEIGFDHGVAQLREPGEQLEWTGAHASLDVRLHAPSGFGALVRFGTTLGTIMTLELDGGATYRAWLHRRGPRGLQLGGGVGASLFQNELAPRVGVETRLAAGGFVTVQLDYREHGWFVGIAYRGRWLPIRDTNEGIDTFSFDATARVGGEITL